jgi:hypothetical protein
MEEDLNLDHIVPKFDPSHTILNSLYSFSANTVGKELKRNGDNMPLGHDP